MSKTILRVILSALMTPALCVGFICYLLTAGFYAGYFWAKEVAEKLYLDK